MSYLARGLFAVPRTNPPSLARRAYLRDRLSLNSLRYVAATPAIEIRSWEPKTFPQALREHPAIWAYSSLRTLLGKDREWRLRHRRRAQRCLCRIRSGHAVSAHIGAMYLGEGAAAHVS